MREKETACNEKVEPPEELPGPSTLLMFCKKAAGAAEAADLWEAFATQTAKPTGVSHSVEQCPREAEPQLQRGRLSQGSPGSGLPSPGQRPEDGHPLQPQQATGGCHSEPPAVSDH